MSADSVPPPPLDHLSTAQVANRLGVKRESIYAYVSRGLLPRVTIQGRRGSWFRADVVDALQSNGSRGSHTGLAERIHTRITLLINDEQYYRGHDVSLLARRSTFEQVCALLWETTAVRIAIPDQDAAPVPNGRVIDVIRSAIGLSSARQAVRGDTGREATIGAASEHIGAAVAALPRLGRTLGPRAAGSDAVAAALWPRLTRRRANPQWLATLSAALIVLADHELAASTTAARVAASARTDISGVLLAALGAMDSPLHGGAPGAARRLLREARRDPGGVISSQLAEDRRPPGFGHLVYREHDPRAELLLEMVREMPGVDDALLATTDRLLTEWRDRRDWFPNSDFALAVLAEAADFRDGAGEAVFTIARLAGWTAHALEEYAESPLRFRLLGVYVGVRPGDL